MANAHTTRTRCSLLLIGLFIIALAHSSHAQVAHSPWQTTISRTSAVATSPSGSTILVSGQVGYLLRSTDSGKTWDLPFSGTYNDLQDLAWLDEETAYAVGANSYVSWSTDGGSTWQEGAGEVYPNQNFSHVRVIPGSEQVVVMSDSILLRGKVSESEWQPLLSRPGTLRTLFLYDSLRGIVSIEGEGLLRTPDGGDTWDIVEEINGSVVTSIDADPESGFSVAALDNGDIYESRDFGISWQRLTSVDLIPQVALVGPKGVVIGGISKYPSSFNHPILGRIDTATTTWRTLHLTSHWGGEGVIDVAEASSESLISTTNSGGVFRYGSGIDTPEVITISYLFTAKTLNVSGSSFQNADTGLIVSPPSGRLTTDGGATWQSGPLSGADPFGLIYTGADKGYMWLDTYFSRLYRWRGPGHSLEFSEPTVDIDGIQINTRLIHFEWQHPSLVGYGIASSNATRIYLGTTLDTGRSFRGMQHDLQGYFFLNVSFSDDGFGLLTSNGGGSVRVFRTTDSLATLTFVGEVKAPNTQDWVITVHSPGRAFRCRQMDDTTRTESRCELLETTDGGDSWHPFHQFEGPVALSFLTDRVWIATSTYARLWISYDAGETWTREEIDPVPIREFATRLYPTNFGKAQLSSDGRAVYIPASNGLFFRTEFEESLLGVEGESSPPLPAAVRVVPNPVRDLLHLSWHDLSPADVQIFDLAGRQVLMQSVIPGSTGANVSTASLIPGRYQFVLRDSQGGWIASGQFMRGQ